AYLGWGATLLTEKKYEEAVPPLRTAVRLAPQNPDVHHALATALERSGHKEEAQREFAIHRSLTSAQPSGKPE
ncbi:MAG: tetratricopeptide repeat protein, partial [Candidatus Sulfotelmatobacter sp.]